MDPQGPNVVILDAAGTRHVFPPGFDPKRAVRIVRGGSATGDVPAGDLGMKATVNGQPFDGEEASREAGAKSYRQVADAAIGAGKTILEQAARGGALLRKIPGVDALANALPYVDLPESAITPTNTAQKVGKYGFQIAQSIAPAKAIAGAGEATAMRLAPALSRLFGGTAARLVPNAAVQGLGWAGLTAAQGGSPTVGGLTGAAGPVLGAASGPIGSWLRSQAVKGVTRFLGPTTGPLRAEAKKVVPEMLERGITGTRGSVLGRATEQAGAPGAAPGLAGRAVTAAEKATAAANPGNIVPTATVAYEINKILDKTVMAGAKGKPLIKPGSEKLAQVAKQYLTFLKKLGPNISFEKAADLKRSWQEVARMANAYNADAETKVAGKVASAAARAMRRELLAVNPDLQAVWHEYGFWEGIRKTLQHTVDLKTTQKNWGNKVIASMWAVIGAGGGAAHGTMTGQMTPEMAAGSALAYSLSMAVQSPTWKLVSAQLKNQLSHAMAANNPSAIKTTLGAITKSMAAQAASGGPALATAR